MSFLKHFSIFVLIIICFSSFMSGGGGVRRGGARKEVLQVDLPYASQLSFLNINRYFLFVSGKSCQQAKHPVENVICAPKGGYHILPMSFSLSPPDSWHAAEINSAVSDSLGRISGGMCCNKALEHLM